MPVQFRTVTPATFPDLVSLMESRGGPRHCWCLLWREPTSVRQELNLAGRRELMQQHVEAGPPVGLLAYEGEQPVGWCSVAPRETYRPLGGPADGEDVWSIVCFFVPRNRRGTRLGEALLDAAVDLAQEQGARIVEAYPVDPESPSYRYMGFVPMFERAGFREVGRVGIRRHVMRRELTPV